MEKRKLGHSGLEVAPLALGTNVFGWTIDEPTSFRILDAFTDAGFNLVDTADVYSNWKPGNKGGESETIIGNWLRQNGRRHSVIIATKVGGDMGQGKKSLARQHILKAVDASLKRLQTDYIDLYQSHWDDPDTPVEETMSAYAELVKTGKVRAIGASNFTSKRLMASMTFSEQQNLPRYESLQPEYNLYNRATFEKDLAPLCLEKGIGVINYYALASGFLTGKYRVAEDAGKSSRGAAIVKHYLNARGLDILNALDELAHRYNTDHAAVALAWNLAQPAITAPISSATSIQQLESLIRGATLELDAAALDILNKASAY